MLKRSLIIVIAAALTAVFAASLAAWPLPSAANKPRPAPKTNAVNRTAALKEPKTFASYEALAGYIEQYSKLANLANLYFYDGSESLRAQEALPRERAMAAPKAAVTDQAVDEHSLTNVQVEGVDEADIVKTDGKYLYALTGGKIVIIGAYPPEKAQLLSTVEFPGSPIELFIAGDRMVVFGTADGSGEFTAVIYDIADREKPVLEKTITSPAQYVTSRLIGDYAYVILNADVYDPRGSENGKPALPRISLDGQKRVVPPTRIHYFDIPDSYYRYTMILSVNIKDRSYRVAEKTFLTGASQNVFASQKNIYLTSSKAPDILSYTDRLFDQIIPLLRTEPVKPLRAVPGSAADAASMLNELESRIDDYLSGLSTDEAERVKTKIRSAFQKWQESMAQEAARAYNTTVIHRLTLSGNRITYSGKGEVAGHVLNQFSMDEHGGYFRIATTTEGFSFTGPSTSRNNIYVLDENMKVVGKLLGLAAGERIYSVRFMGDRCYLVTFRRVDPLFAVDLKDPRNPKVLGELKITGYSDYLHPYDERYLIGIGKEVNEGPVPAPVPERAPMIVPPRPQRETGIKIALFDVADPTRPKEAAKYVIEGQSVDSIALHNHKAVLFSKAKNLLAIPVSSYPPYRIMADEKTVYYIPKEEAYVFNISPGGIQLKGTLEHSTLDPDKTGHAVPVKRCLYIGNVLYTVSDEMVKMHSLSDLSEINQIPL